MSECSKMFVSRDRLCRSEAYQNHPEERLHATYLPPDLLHGFGSHPAILVCLPLCHHTFLFAEVTTRWYSTESENEPTQTSGALPRSSSAIDADAARRARAKVAPPSGKPVDNSSGLATPLRSRRALITPSTRKSWKLFNRLTSGKLWKSSVVLNWVTWSPFNFMCYFVYPVRIIAIHIFAAVSRGTSPATALRRPGSSKSTATSRDSSPDNQRTFSGLPLRKGPSVPSSPAVSRKNSAGYLPSDEGDSGSQLGSQTSLSGNDACYVRNIIFLLILLMVW